MIDLYTWPTPNGRKVSILLAELGVDYRVHAVDITRGAQHSETFAALSPTRKIPLLVDRETGLTLSESNAILLYLAEKHRRFLPGQVAARAQAISWLMWQGAALGPMAGQAHVFLHDNPGRAPFAEEKFHATVRKLYAVLDRRLEGRSHVCDSYSIVDMACFPWIARHPRHRVALAEFANVAAWYRRMSQRPAVQAGYHVPFHRDGVPRA
ncbi:glutathione S-transferase family protein [Microbulbifer sp. S227A]|uniref:glutathione S-transferase family protein n=1 Tax=Microbulbifer sp. S227A TaxID=3415131 RepID=UPI003C7D9F2B